MTDDKLPSGSPALPKAGALSSTLTIELHSHHAIRLWTGRQKQTGAEGGAGRAPILSMPMAIHRTGKIQDDAALDNPYADACLISLEDRLNQARQRIEGCVADLQAVMSALPKQVSLTEVACISPLNIGIYSRTPAGYRCVWLLVGFDELARLAFQAHHYGLISRTERDKRLSQGAHAVRQVYGVIQSYRPFSVTRADIEARNEAGLAAIEKGGELDSEILLRKRRSVFSPDIRRG